MMSRCRQSRRSLEGGLLFAIIVVASAMASAVLAQTNETRPPVVLQGRLINSPGSSPVLKTKEKDLPLAGRTVWLLHTLQDKRLADREIRVEGEWQPDGSLKVNHFFTLRDGKVYRVRYFCEICNIEAFEPGNCVCCQQPTELQEIPAEGK